MTRPQLTAILPDLPRESRKVKTVASILELEASQVRRLVETGELQSHTVGKRGVRVYLDSVADYQARQARTASRTSQPGKLPVSAPRRPSPASTAAHRSAVALLQKHRIL